MHKIKNILIANLASPANPGDQAILKGSLKLIREILHPETIRLSTRAFSQKKVYEALGCEVVPSYPDVDCLSMDDSLRKVMRVPQALSNPGILIKAVQESDCVFLAGGAYFYSYRKTIPGLTYLAHISPVWMAKCWNKPVIFLPQSYGPFCSGVSRALFKACLARSKRIFYREDISAKSLNENFSSFKPLFTFMPDLALYLKPEDLRGNAPRNKKSSKILGITIRPWSADGQGVDVYLEALSKTVISFALKYDLTVRIIVQVQDNKKEEGDEAVSRQLQVLLMKSLQAGKVELFTEKPYFDLEKLCGLYEECDVMISMRLHSALLAYILGCPALVTGYQHKAAGILEKLGLSDLYLGSYNQVTPEGLSAKLEDVWNRREQHQERIREVLEQARQQIRETFKESLV